MRLELLGIYVLGFVYATRFRDQTETQDIASADGAEDFLDCGHFTNFQEKTHLLSHASSTPGSVGEEVSAEEMQRGLLDFLKRNQAGDLPKFKKPSLEYTDFLHRTQQDPKSACQKQMGGLLLELATKCQRMVGRKQRQGKGNRNQFFFSHLTDLPLKTCPESAEDLFLHGRDVVRAQQVGNDFAKDTPTATKPLLQAGLFLKEWIVELVTSEKAGILWAGFWTNASDPEGHKSRTSKESLFHFADRIETQTVHPSTKLGQLAEKYGNLAGCEGPVENELKGNMWSLFSFAFVYGMREKKQDVVVALVHKEMDGERPLDQSVLFQYEVPTIGIAAWGLGYWSPQVVLIDLLGTCKQTSPALRKQLYYGLPEFYENLVKEFEWSKSDFIWRSRLSWTCLDCPHSHCQLDEGLAKQVKELLQAKRQQDQRGAALIRAAKTGDVSRLEELLNDGADVNFQDKEGDTPLSFAVQNGHTAAAQLLLKHNAYVDARNLWGETPLFRARSLKLEDLLLEHGANRNAMDFANRTEMKF